MAKIHFKYGAMNSGKTDTLIKTAHNYEERELNVVVIKPEIDTKGGTTITARGGHSREVDILADRELNLRHEIAKRSFIACVLVDEAQFLTPDQISQLYSVAKEDDISVICYGLRTDFRTQLFPGSQRLLEVADNIEKLPTMCFCGSQAEFNTRKVNGNYIFTGDQVAIDGEDEVEYDSLCGSCYAKEGGTI
jgi:thymidine kinase